MSDFSDRLAELMRKTAGGPGDAEGAPVAAEGAVSGAGTPPAPPAAAPENVEAPVASAAAPPPPPVNLPAPPTAVAPPAAAPTNPTPTGAPQAPVRTGQQPQSSQVRPVTGGPRTKPAKGRFDDLKESVHEELLVQLGPKLYDANLSPAELEAMVRQALADVIASTDRPLTSNDRQRITQEIADDILGYGPLEPYLRDDSVAEVMVNGPFDIWLERKGRLVRVDGSFNDEAHLRRTIDKIVSRIGRRI